MDFDAIEDVQILLNYRHWSRFKTTRSRYGAQLKSPGISESTHAGMAAFAAGHAPPAAAHIESLWVALPVESPTSLPTPSLNW